jgi:hypothetical protein
MNVSLNFNMFKWKGLMNIIEIVLLGIPTMFWPNCGFSASKWNGLLQCVWSRSPHTYVLSNYSIVTPQLFFKISSIFILFKMLQEKKCKVFDLTFEDTRWGSWRSCNYMITHVFIPSDNYAWKTTWTKAWENEMEVERT